MATNPSNYFSENLLPLSDYDLKVRNLFGGNKNAIRYTSRYGLLNDNSVLKSRIEGRSPRMGSTYRGSTSGGRTSSSFGGSNTPDNPGGYNWDTLSRNLDRIVNAAGTAVNYRMENQRLAQAKQSSKDKTAQDLADRFDAMQAKDNQPFEDPLAPTSAMPSAPAITQPIPTTTFDRPTISANPRRPGKASPYSGPQPPAPPRP